MDSQKPKLFIATKAFVVHNGKVLILRESSNNPVGTNANKFDVVGGRLNPGEQWDECLRREIKEESGLDVTIGTPFYVGEWRPVVHCELWQIIGVFFVCHAAIDAVVLSQDHDSFLWIDPATSNEYPLIDNLVPAFAAFRARSGAGQ